MKQFFLLFGMVVFWGLGAIAQSTPTFSEDIAPIIYEHCSSCHRPGEIGPMPFTNYQEVKDWANMIEYVTSIRYMPPWKPNPDFSSFLGENFLEEEEIQLIMDWVAEGMPEGDPALAPPFPVFPSGSQIGEPDLVLSFAEAFTQPGSGEDTYRIFVLPTELPEDKDLAAIELRPGNPTIVHHALFTYDTSGVAAANAAADPIYGYDGFGGFGVPGTFDRQFPAYVPGQKPRFYPEGIGQRIPADADLLVQMHYAPSPIDQTDSSTINLFFLEEPAQRYVQSHVMLPFFGTLQNGPFILAPEEIKTFHGIWEVEDYISLLGLGPHMHLLGKDWTVMAIRPTGDTINLVQIEDWDFNWQGGYFFDRFITLEPGSEIHAYATYDNTSSNPSNPNNPPAWVSWGEGTTDEMYYLPIMYVPYAFGDEDIVFTDDPILSTAEENLRWPEQKMYPVFPNPGQTSTVLGFELQEGQPLSIQLFDIEGNLVRTIQEESFFMPGLHQMEISLKDLSEGIYIVRIEGAYWHDYQKLIKLN